MIVELLRQKATALRLMGSPSLEAYVLTYGREYTPAPLPAHVPRGEKKACYTNALTCAAAYDYE